MKMYMALYALIMLVAFSPQAQERAAGNSLEAQMNWAALSKMVKDAKDAATALEFRIQKQEICGRKGKVFAPGGTGLDADTCKDADIDLTSITNSINALNSNMTKVMVCNAKGMVYAPTVAGRDAQDCVSSGGGFKPANVITSINGANGFPPNTNLTAASDLFVSASSYGGGGESCPVSGSVNGVQVAKDYAIRYASGVSFMVPKGRTWRVDASGGNCSGRQTNISVLPLN